MPPWTHRDVTASGVRVRVAEVGEGPPLVLLHGLFHDHTTWNALAERLAPAHRVIAPDLPGFGESEKPAPRKYPYGVPALADAVTDLFGALRLGRAALAGHALGGAVALAVTARHPELVSRLAVINAHVYPLEAALPRRLALTPMVGRFWMKQLWGRAAFLAALDDRTLHHGDPRLERYFELFDEPSARSSALATLHGTVDVRPVTAALGRVAQPSLVLWGRHDRQAPAAHGQRLARELGGAGFALLDAGAAPQHELPSEVARVLGGFLAGDRDARPARAS